MSNRSAIWILAALLLTQAAIHWALLVPGPLLVDEVAYQFMTRSVADGHPWEVENGYREYPSPALEVAITHTVTAHEDHLVAKYPYMLPWVAAALYPSLGFASLIAVNWLAHSVVLLLTWWLARHFLRSPAWALGAPVCLELGTFFWEYAEAAWPHSLAMAFTTGAFSCALKALDAGDDRRLARCWALASGVLIGLGAGARLDSVLWLLIIGCSFLGSPRPIASIAWTAAGASAALLPLCVDNYEKLGVFWPFVYRRESLASFSAYGRYFVPLGGVFLAALTLLAWRNARTGPSLRAWARRTSPILGLSIASVVVIALLMSAGGRRWLNGLFDIAVDFSALDPARRDPAMARTPSGGALYFGHYKKALLQSCPYLPALIVPLFAHWRRFRDGSNLWALYVPLPVLLAVFAAKSWHGGMCLNMRYLLPALPMTSVLTVWVIRATYPRSARGWWAAAAAVVASVALYSGTSSAGPTLELKLLVAPVVLSACLVIVSLLNQLDSLRAPRMALRNVLFSLLAMALAWAVQSSLLYDYPAQRDLRASNWTIAEAVRTRIESDALLFIPFIDPFAGLIDAKKVILAMPFQDQLESLAPLARYHLQAGRPVYGAFPLPLWVAVRSRANQEGLLVGAPEVLPGGYVLAALSTAERVAAETKGP